MHRYTVLLYRICCLFVSFPAFSACPFFFLPFYYCRTLSISFAFLQLWVVFKRYRDFVALRQDLKTACQQLPKPPSTSARNKSHTPAKRSFAAPGGRGSGFVAGGGRRRGGVGGGGRGGGGVMASPELVERVKRILTQFRFPNKLALGGSVALRQERRKALHAFLVALVRRGW